MIELEAPVFRHVGSRMFEVCDGPVDDDDFMKVGDVKRLLETARRQGFERAQHLQLGE